MEQNSLRNTGLQLTSVGLNVSCIRRFKAGTTLSSHQFLCHHLNAHKHLELIRTEEIHTEGEIARM